jgi:hypothetical protein
MFICACFRPHHPQSLYCISPAHMRATYRQILRNVPLRCQHVPSDRPSSLSSQGQTVAASGCASPNTITPRAIDVGVKGSGVHQRSTSQLSARVSRRSTSTQGLERHDDLAGRRADLPNWGRRSPKTPPRCPPRCDGKGPTAPPQLLQRLRRQPMRRVHAFAMRRPQVAHLWHSAAANVGQTVTTSETADQRKRLRNALTWGGPASLLTRVSAGYGEHRWARNVDRRESVSGCGGGGNTSRSMQSGSIAGARARFGTQPVERNVSDQCGNADDHKRACNDYLDDDARVATPWRRVPMPSGQADKGQRLIHDRALTRSAGISEDQTRSLLCHSPRCDGSGLPTGETVEESSQRCAVSACFGGQAGHHGPAMDQRGAPDAR